MTEAPPPRVVMCHYSLKVYFGDVLHLRIPRGEIGPIQAWRDGPTHFSIQYTLKGGGMVTTEYDCPKKWGAVLAGLDRELP